MRTAVNQYPSAGTLYPFSLPTSLAATILDFYFSYEDTSCETAWPLQLHVSSTEIGIKSNFDVVLFLADILSAETLIWGSRIVYEWITSNAVVRLLATALTPGEGILDPRTCNRLPKRVLTLRTSDEVMRGAVSFVAGFNIDMRAETTTRTSGTKHIDRIYLDAVPGAGEGRQPGCEEIPAQIFRINGVSANSSGDFQITSDACIRNDLALTRTEEQFAYAYPGKTEEEARASLVLESDCQPCYTCEAFARTYKGLARVWDRWKRVANKAEQTRDVYHANHQRWTDQLACRRGTIANITLTPQNDCNVDVGGIVCNFSQECLRPVELRFTFEFFSGKDSAPWPVSTKLPEAYLVGGPTRKEEPAVPLVENRVFRLFLDYADPQQTAVARLRTCVSCAQGDSVRVTLSVHAGPADHSLTPIAVPDEIAGIWSEDVSDDSATHVIALVQTSAPLNPQPASYDCSC